MQAVLIDRVVSQMSAGEGVDSGMLAGWQTSRNTIVAALAGITQGFSPQIRL